MEEGDLNIMMQEGASDGSGPAEGRFGYGETEANAKISIRGNTARYAPQRSYKIRLNKQAGLWRDQRTLNLNKHYDDPSRIRNKLSYDIFETLPDIASLRTQFVHLYVKDLTDKNGAAAGFADYGLYTHVEQPNKMFLKNHWLDPNGQLYKAVMFEFFRYPESLKSQSDPDYDKAAFEQVLEIEGREDHDKLLAMLDDVNDMSIPIRDVIDRHFDLDNYLTWLAANILMDNMDTDAQNYLLYSPLNSDNGTSCRGITTEAGNCSGGCTALAIMRTESAIIGATRCTDAFCAAKKMSGCCSIKSTSCIGRRSTTKRSPNGLRRIVRSCSRSSAGRPTAIFGRSEPVSWMTNSSGLPKRRSVPCSASQKICRSRSRSFSEMCGRTGMDG
ncbi:hypothetical protein PACILC2_43390 [Paenibacillus cisolokensis]|uniref:Spore coat protein CotH n=1 Tax=Paenibacillus cisolokensis TaxID=1658519 RepID=A0ABQ4NC14_9BACL|nr:hypothetical protein PACILC2_43390 [Paenibacillus cisolokensis]